MKRQLISFMQPANRAQKKNGHGFNYASISVGLAKKTINFNFSPTCEQITLMFNQTYDNHLDN